MTRAALRVGWYRFRRTFRRRWPALLTLTVLVALLGGLAMAAVAGARRTQSAYPAYLASSHASDLQVGFYTNEGASVAGDLYSPVVTARFAALPHVRHVSAVVQMFAAPADKNGKPDIPPPLQNNIVYTEGSFGGYGFTRDGVVADESRLADPRRPDEMMATPEAARLLHWKVGQMVSFDIFSIQQLFDAGFGPPQVPPVMRARVRLVGIVSLSTSVVGDQIDRYPTPVLFTPALTAEALRLGAGGFPTYNLTLDNGAADVAAVEREFIRALPANSTYTFHVTSVVEGALERAVKPESIAIGVFGLIAALATLFIAGQAVSRGIRSEAQDLDIVRALGADPAMTVADSLLGTVLAIVVGALLAGAVSVALSPIAPLGVVRQIDPSPGFTADWTVLLAGFAFLVVVLMAIAVLVAAMTIMQRTTRSAAPGQQNSSVVGLAVRLGLPPASVAGVRFAVERGRGRDAVPVGSALLGAAVAVAVVVTTLTFGSSLSTLISSPHLYGWNWDYALAEDGGGNIPPSALHMLGNDPYVAAWSGMNFASAQVDGVTVPIILQETGARVVPPILTGRTVQAKDEIVLGGTTLAELHKHVGDTVVASYGGPSDFPIYVPPTKVRIVGTATLPAVGNAGALHTSMGTGAILDTGIEPPAMQAALVNPDPNVNGPGLVVVRLRTAAPAGAGLSSLEKIAVAATKTLAADPSAGGGQFSVLPVQQPAEIENYRSMGDTPAALAAALAAGAVVALGLILIASVNRRRHDLALLRTLGFLQRQLGAVIAWQASIAALVGLVVGIPLGIIMGRVLWDLFAAEIVAVPHATVPAVQIVLVGVGAVVLANLVSLVPARLAARTRTSQLLRND